MDPFHIFEVPPESAEFSEQMGTKFKFWYQDDQFGLTLFKEGRPGTGENWAEKISCELAKLLEIPRATYELARWRNQEGIISPNFVPKNARLIHGNELVGGKVIAGAQDAKVHFYHERSHTASRVFQFFKQSEQYLLLPQGATPIEGIKSALDMFVGYLMFDVWIANQDRHSENWALIKLENQFFLAPTYDHGSSLGRQEKDERRHSMLTTRDKGASIEAYILKARSAMYPNASSDQRPKALFSIELFLEIAKMNPDAAKIWLRKLGSISRDDIQAVVDSVPENIISPIAREFTIRLLELNKQRLISLKI